MLKNIPKENIAQVFLSTDIPDFEICNYYFEMNDFDVIRKMLYRNEYAKQVKVDDINNKILIKKKEKSSKTLQIVRNIKGPLFNIFRDSIWMIAGYREKKLIDFIKKFKPNVLFFHSSGNVFSFKIAEWISRKYNLKIILETTDDYLGYRPTINPFFYVLNYMLNKEYKIIAKKASLIIVISDEMKKKYIKKYPCEYYIAMNSVEIKMMVNKVGLEKKIKILYSGNIELNRWKTILLLSKVIEKIDYVDIELNIYTLTNISKYIKSKFKKYSKTGFRNAVNSEQLAGIRQDSDILLHVESFDMKNKYITRYSISTKISEYLASGKAILAIGPDSIASIKYLKREGVAEVVTHPNEKEIKKALSRLFSREYRDILAQKGFTLAKEKHNIEKVACDIEAAIKSAIS